MRNRETNIQTPFIPPSSASTSLQISLHLPEWCSEAGACNQSITALCFSFLLAPFFCSRVGSRSCIPVRSVLLLQDGVCHGLQGTSALLWGMSSSGLGVPSSFLHLAFSALPLDLFSPRCPVHGWGLSLPCRGLVWAGWDYLCLAWGSPSCSSQWLPHSPGW